MRKRRRGNHSESARFQWRGYFLQTVFAVAAIVLLVRALDLQVLDDGFLNDQGEARFLRNAEIAAHRGKITDRFGRPLAVSTPVDTIAADPKRLSDLPKEDLSRLANVLRKPEAQLQRQIERASDKEFIYLKRHLRPTQAAKALALDIPGVRRVREYRRYYPAGEVAAQVLGFTNIDDVGQEGVELAFNQWLSGTPGAKRVLKDRLGRSIKDVESIRPPSAGKDLSTSLDMRIQYLAYRELMAAVNRHKARSGSVVVLDVKTGEVLAMVNQPSYNPNNRGDSPVAAFRNRAITDIFEPGSSFKPLVIAAALESGLYSPGTRIDTSPGFLQVGLKTIPDSKDFGQIDVTGVLTNSSNVGAAKIALSLEPEYLWGTLARFGIGRLTDSGFPGESAGLLNHFDHWREINHATIAYGYGLTVTPLQLAQAYATMGSGGVRRSVSFLSLDKAAEGERVITETNARLLIDMMETVVLKGTGQAAAVPGYRVAGKTGTARKSELGGYSSERHNAVFAGLAPASNPRLVCVVLIEEPTGDTHYGGDVAAPVFSEVVSGALRLIDIAPDRLDTDSLVARTSHDARR